ncbi:MAG TPA: hypothetical protein DEA08_14800 [Planctomycetes bacterium]|nr:hypothetical protein [Planctomycetota bacterium]
MTGPSVELRAIEDERCCLRLKPGSSNLVGRSPQNDWTLAHRSVSRSHARLVWAEHDPRPTVEDLGSANGTFVDGLRMAAHDVATLTEGAILGIGELEFRVTVHKAVAGPALLEEEAESTGIVTLVGGDRRRAGVAESWEELRGLLLQLEDERATGTLHLEFGGCHEEVVVLMGSLLLDRRQGVTLLGRLRDSQPPLSYRYGPDIQIGTIGSRGWRVSELVSLLEDGGPTPPTTRV